MKKIISIVIVIFTLLLISTLSGCINDVDVTPKNIDDDYIDTSSPTIISLSDLKDHPNRYLNKTTTTKAYFSRSDTYYHRGDYFVIY